MNDFFKMIFCASGIYVSYLLYGLVQESIYKFQDADGETFHYTLTFLSLQCLANMCGAIAGALITRTPPTVGVPPTSLLIPASTFIGAMFCSNQALRYVSYPIQALGKSCKMVPVMAYEVLWYHKKYAFLDYLMVFLVTLGIVAFQYKNKGGETQIYGLVLLFASLILDGMTGPRQEEVKRIFRATPHQLMFYCNMWASVLLAAGLVLTGELFVGFSFILANEDLLQKILLFSVCSAVGQNFIFMTLDHFNALVLTTVTTTRKFFTVLVSVIYFGHQLNELQYFGIALVSVGLGIELYNKYNRAASKMSKKKDS
eukprot:m.241956 g.241956  ORF g.241956 m.241956 type:complete len:314 (+) comp19431_c0_seq4:2213-3154(+)